MFTSNQKEASFAFWLFRNNVYYILKFLNTLIRNKGKVCEVKRSSPHTHSSVLRFLFPKRKMWWFLTGHHHFHMLRENNDNNSLRNKRTSLRTGWWDLRSHESILVAQVGQKSPQSEFLTLEWCLRLLFFMPLRVFEVAEGTGDLLGWPQPLGGQGSVLWGTPQPLVGRREKEHGGGHRQNGRLCREERPALSASALRLAVLSQRAGPGPRAANEKRGEPHTSAQRWWNGRHVAPLGCHDGFGTQHVPPQKPVFPLLSCSPFFRIESLFHTLFCPIYLLHPL